MGRARTGLGYDWHAWHIFVAMGPAALAYGLVRWIDSTGEREEWERNMKERKAAAGDGGVMDGGERMRLGLGWTGGRGACAAVRRAIARTRRARSRTT